MSEVNIRSISPEETWPIRHEAMWPEEDMAYVRLERDDLDGRHLGLFVEGELVSVISWFMDGADTAQFRKFATLPGHQKRGYGGHLIRSMIEDAKQAGVRKLWCNARIEQTGFYGKIGLVVKGDHFKKNGLRFVIMELDLGQALHE